MPPIMSPDVRLQVAKRLAGLRDPVTAAVYAGDSEEGAALMELARELSQLAPAVQVTTPEDGSVKAPAIRLTRADGAATDGVWFHGFPGGYEFGVLLDDLVDLSTGRNALSERTQEVVRSIDKSVEIQVYVTPT